MTIEEMRDKLTNIQNESSQTKILNAILTCYSEIKILEQKLFQTQKIVNQIITLINNSTKREGAKTVNFQEDAPVNEPAPQVSEEDK